MLQYISFFALIFIVLCDSDDYDDHDHHNSEAIAAFSAFVITYNKTYSSLEERQEKENIFIKNFKYIQLLKKEDPSYDITKYADWDHLEIQRLKNRNNTVHKSRRMKGVQRFVRKWDDITCHACKRWPLYSRIVPENWDWVEMGAVIPPRDQGYCGNCFAYAATGDIEGSWFLASPNNELTALSVQQITDCDRFGDDLGCEGASTNLDTFAYVIENGGLAAAEDYPLTYTTLKKGKEQPCDYVNAKRIAASIGGALQISGNTEPRNEERVRRALYFLGPMTIGINAKNLQYYHGGVAKPRYCANGWDDLDHQVMIVGYGIDKDIPYWKIRNSWGTNWGEGGYFRLYRGSNLCGVVTDVVHSIVD